MSDHFDDLEENKFHSKNPTDRNSNDNPSRIY